VVGRRCLLQQLPGLLCVQADGQGVGMPVQVAPLRVIARQLMAHAAKLALPPVQLVAQRIAAGVAGQARSPVGHGVGLGRQWLTAIQRLQVFEQHTPGHAIDHQVVDRQQQALGALPVTDQQGAQQRAPLQVEAALHVGIQRLAVGEVGDRGGPQQLLG
jgi:hypothetical protein